MPILFDPSFQRLDANGPTKSFASMNPVELARWNEMYDENGYERPKSQWGPEGPTPAGTGGPALGQRPTLPVAEGPDAAPSDGQPTPARPSQIYRAGGYIFAPDGKGGHINLGRDHAASRVGGRW